MRRVVTLVVLAVAGWYAYQNGWPWLKEKLDRIDDRGGESFSEGPASGCLNAAHRARDRVVAAIRDLGPPPGDPDAWDRASREAGDSIRDAQSACRCAGEACRRAEEALAELRGMVSRFDDVVRGGGSRFANPARGLERVDALLASARGLDAVE